MNGYELTKGKDSRIFADEELETLAKRRDFVLVSPPLSDSYRENTKPHLWVRDYGHLSIFDPPYRTGALYAFRDQTNYANESLEVFAGKAMLPRIRTHWTTEKPASFRAPFDNGNLAVDEDGRCWYIKSGFMSGDDTNRYLSFLKCQGIVNLKPINEATGHVDMVLKPVGNRKILVGQLDSNDANISARDRSLIEEYKSLIRSKNFTPIDVPIYRISTFQGKNAYHSYINSVIVDPNTVVVPTADSFYTIPELLERHKAAVRSAYSEAGFSNVIMLVADGLADLRGGGGFHCATVHLTDPPQADACSKPKGFGKIAPAKKKK